MPAMMRSSVLLPEPFLPIRPSVSPGVMLKEMFFNAQSVSFVSRKRLWKMPMKLDFKELLLLWRMVKALETLTISISGDTSSLRLFGESNLTARKHDIPQRQRQAAHRKKRQKMKGPWKYLPIKNILVARYKKGEGIQIDGRTQRLWKHSDIINDRRQPE